MKTWWTQKITRGSNAGVVREKLLVKMYRKGASLSAIAKTFSKKPDTVRRKLNRLGYTLTERR